MVPASVGEYEPASGDGFLCEILEDLGAFLCDVETDTLRVISVSRQAETILGYPVERWTQEPDFLEAHLHHDDRAPVLSRLRLEVGSGRRSAFAAATSPRRR